MSRPATAERHDIPAQEPPRGQKENALTQNPAILKTLLLFALPIIAGNLFNQLYNVADSIVVGQFVSSDALAAVGSCFTIQMVIFSLFLGLGTGANVVISQFFGARNKRDVARTIGTAYIIALGLGALFTVVGVLISRPILQLVNTPANIMEDSVTYLGIVFLGSIGNLFYNMGNALLRGLGDSRGPFIILVFCTSLNVTLDLLFVIVFGWGVAGVAWATIIAQGISAVWVVLRTLRGRNGVRLDRSCWRPDWKLAWRVCRIGLPVAAQSALMSSGMLAVQSIINSFGSDVVAANTAVMKVDGFLVMPMMGLGSAITTFTGQNIGAGRLDRVRSGVARGALIIVAFTLVLAVPVFLFGGPMVRLFTDNTDVITIAGQGLQTLAFFYVFMGISQIYTGAVRGAGFMLIPMLITVVSFVVRIPLAWLLAIERNDHMGIYYSMIIANFIGAGLIFLYYTYGRWRKKVDDISRQARLADQEA